MFMILKENLRKSNLISKRYFEDMVFNNAIVLPHLEYIIMFGGNCGISTYIANKLPIIQNRAARIIFSSRLELAQ